MDELLDMAKKAAAGKADSSSSSGSGIRMPSPGNRCELIVSGVEVWTDVYSLVPAQWLLASGPWGGQG